MAVNFSDELLKYNQLLGLEEDSLEEDAKAHDVEDAITTTEVIAVANPKDIEGNSIEITTELPTESGDVSIDAMEAYEEKLADGVPTEDKSTSADVLQIDSATLTEYIDKSGPIPTETKENPVLTEKQTRSVVDVENFDRESSDKFNVEDEITSDEVSEILNPKTNLSIIPTSDEKLTAARKIDSEPNAGIYQPFGSDISDVGEVLSRTVGISQNIGSNYESRYSKIEDNLYNDIDVFGEDARVENSLTSNDLIFLIYTNIPYVVGATAQAIQGLVNSVSDIVGDFQAGNIGAGAGLKTLETIKLAGNFIDKSKYYTPGEILKSLGTTFLTLQYFPQLKEFEVKYKKRTISATRMSKRSFSELIYGPEGEKATRTSIMGGTVQFMKALYKKLSDSELRIKDALIDKSKIPEDFENVNDMMEAINGFLKETRVYAHEMMQDVYLKYDRPTFAQKGDEHAEIAGVSNQTEVMTLPETFTMYKDEGDSLKKSEDLKPIHNFMIGEPSVSDSSYLTGQYDDSLQYKENGHTINTEKYTLIKSDTENSWKALVEWTEKLKEGKSETADFNIMSILSKVISNDATNHDKYKKIEKYTEGNDPNKNLGVSDFIDFTNPNFKNYTGDLSEKVTRLQQRRDMIKDFKNINSLGYIICYPTLSSGSSPAAAFKIPFQFNPNITESGLTAKYESQQLLHRRGNIYSYVGTEGQTLSLETTYMMTTDGLTDDERKSERKGTGIDTKKDYEWDSGPEDSWYDIWSPKVIQKIESALRSIALPQVENNNGEIKFHKPPMLKIIFNGTFADGTTVGGTTGEGTGDDSGEEKLHPMLTFPVSKTTGTATTSVKWYHRTYIATKVSIEKNMNDSPLYVGVTKEGEGETAKYKNSKIIDTHIFRLKMELAEIDSNYVGVMPNFMDYYNTYKGVVIEQAASSGTGLSEL